MKTCAAAVAEYFAAIRAMDADRWVAGFAPDAVNHDPVGAPPLENNAARLAFLTGIAAGFESLGLFEDNVFINGSSAAVKWTGRGVAKNGKPVTFEGVDVIDCDAEGRIVLVKAYWDPGPVMAIVQS